MRLTAPGFPGPGSKLVTLLRARDEPRRAGAAAGTGASLAGGAAFAFAFGAGAGAGAAAAAVAAAAAAAAGASLVERLLERRGAGASGEALAFAVAFD